MIRPRRGTAYSIRTSVATKADVRDLHLAIGELRAEMMAALNQLRSEMKVWTLTLLLGQTVLFLTCVAAIEVLAG